MCFFKRLLPILFFAFLLSGCPKKPRLNSLDPMSGTSGTVVEVSGSDLFLAGVKWDANTAAETTVPSNFLAAKFFTVPMAANISNHPVRLFGDNQYSDDTINFSVINGTIRPKPRLDDVTVSYFNIQGGKAAMFLMAHGANIDVGAKILVNGVEQQTFFSRLLRNDTNMNSTDPATLGYPIFHYATIWAALSEQLPGANLTVSVKNLDNVVSNDLTYKIVAGMDVLDSDGDGLYDDWEKNGYDANGDGVVDIDLPGLGADPLRKDMFIECDWMAAAAPNAAIWAAVENTFATAPILNSDGSQGITAHIDRGQAGAGGGGGTIIPYADRLRYDNLKPDTTKTYANFYTVKSNNFNANRKNIYRYCIFGWDSGHKTGESGRAESIWGNDFFVTLASWGADGGRTDFQTGTFIHELGHTLNLLHGGFENANSKDNYNSIMQYGNDWIIWNGQNNVYSPSQFGGIDIDCNQLNVDGIFTYSQGMRTNLDENSLNENNGCCDNISRDWNGNGNIQNFVAVNLDDNAGLTVIKDNDDWAKIELDFRAAGSSWGNN